MAEMIQPKEHAERSQEHFDLYRPKLEELFNVSLEDIVVEDREAYLESRSFNYLRDLEAKQKEREKAERRLGWSAAMYDDYHRTIYMTYTKPLSDASLANYTVHEAVHAVHHTLQRFRQAKWLHQRPLRRIVEEGFAEFVSLETFKPYYGLPDIEPDLEERRKWHKDGNMIYVRDKLHRFHEYFKDGEIIVPQEMKSNRLKAALHKVRMRLVCFFSGSPEEYFHSVGYVFFKTVCDAGLAPLDIVQNPPRSMETIIEPIEYIESLLVPIEHIEEMTT